MTIADLLTYSVYLALLACMFGLFVRRRANVERTSLATYAEAVDAGMTQPASLHPLVDPTRCIGCESCVHACPEFPAHQVLGIVGNKAQLVSPTDCIGHGTCQRVCPVDAITLVFGTEQRGVDIPTVNDDFSTNVEGVFIAGELGGMGLIRNAIEQGRQAIAAIAGWLDDDAADRNRECLDVAIVGAGPAGMSATLGAMEAGLSHVTIEQNALGGTVANFPRGKLVMTAPAVLPLVGQVKFRETLKEELVGFWQDVQRKTGMQINCNETLLEVERTADGPLLVRTDKTTYTTRALLLAIGRRGTPRALGVAGEDQAKVTYSMIDPAQYAGQAVLVVGGGDSALEAANAIADEPDTTVTLCYRGDAFNRAKKKNREGLTRRVHDGALTVLLRSEVQEIHPDHVRIRHGEREIEIANNAIIVCAGGILPTALLEAIGIRMETKYGTA